MERPFKKKSGAFRGQAIFKFHGQGGGVLMASDIGKQILEDLMELIDEEMFLENMLLHKVLIRGFRRMSIIPLNLVIAEVAVTIVSLVPES